MWNAPIEGEAAAVPEPAQQQQLQEGSQDQGEDDEEEEGDDDDDDDEGEQEGSQEVPAVQQQLEELLVAMQVRTHRSKQQLFLNISEIYFIIKFGLVGQMPKLVKNV